MPHSGKCKDDEDDSLHENGSQGSPIGNNTTAVCTDDLECEVCVEAHSGSNEESQLGWYPYENRIPLWKDRIWEEPTYAMATGKFATIPKVIVAMPAIAAVAVTRSLRTSESLLISCVIVSWAWGNMLAFLAGDIFGNCIAVELVFESTFTCAASLRQQGRLAIIRF